MTLRDFKEAVDILRQGGVVVFPTETAYGIAADATDTSAVRRAALVKGRAEAKTPPLIVDSFEMADQFIVMSPKLKRVARQFWPGPLTIVAPVRVKKTGPRLAPGVVRANGTIAVRVSSHPVARGLSRMLQVPIVATSANLAGEPTCYSVAAVRKQFFDNHYLPDLYLDAGPLRRRRPSTIITERKGKIIILRQGPVRIPKTYVA